ncbi:MAG: radical SAM protein [Candidatus Natronoplasma sp.]
MEEKIAYGPVPSRRLGHSLGINNIPPKICTYSCVYCQLGRTLKMQVQREDFYPLEKIVESLEQKIDNALKKDESIDYLTFVSDGEPTLDINLGEEIETVKKFGHKTAVISNSSLIWDKDVREALSKADWVSLKMDAVSPELWKKINRPHKSLDIDRILEGIHEFSDLFTGQLNIETMMVEDLNDDPTELEKITDEIADIGADKSYISIPTRPPSEDWVEPPSEEKIMKAYQIFKDKDIDVEYLIGYEGDKFASSEDVTEDLLSITSVHPMRERQVQRLLDKKSKGWGEVYKLIDDGKLVETQFKDEKFYMRKLE